MTLVADPGVGGGGLLGVFFLVRRTCLFGNPEPPDFFLLISLKIPRDLPFGGP